MKYATVEDVIASFPQTVLPTVQGKPDYQNIHAIRKSLQENSRAIDTHFGGGTLGHLGIIVSDASYTMIAPETDSGPTLWISPQAPGRAPANTDITAAQISAARHVWEEDVQTYRTYTSVQQALKKQIISVFEPMYMDVLNDKIVNFTNISARDMLDHLFSTYGNITTVDLEINFEHMRPSWDPQQPVGSLFKQIQDCADYSEAGGVLIGHPQQINVGYAKIFATGHFTSACHQWNEKPLAEKTWAQFKSHFASAHCQHKQMQGESAATAGYHSTNAAVGQIDDQIAEATIGELANLATATVSDRGVVETLIEANACLVKQLEVNSNDLRELKALIKKERFEKCGQRSFNPSPINYCWTHGYKVANTHTSLSCTFQKQGHKREATRADNIGGSQANKEWCSGATTLNNKSMFEACRTPHFLNHMKHQLWTLDAPATFY
jgi:hypothetical protein